MGPVARFPEPRSLDRQRSLDGLYARKRANHRIVSTSQHAADTDAKQSMLRVI